MTDRGETVPDSSLEGIGGAARNSQSDRPIKADEGSGPVSTESAKTRNAEQGEEPGVADQLNETSTDAYAGAKPSARKSVVTILDANLAMAYSSEPNSVLPPWLMGKDVEAPWKPPGASADGPESVARPQKSVTVKAENKSVAQRGENIGRASEPKPAGALASFVAIQGDDLLKEPLPPERREPQGYITLESKPESAGDAAGRSRLLKPPDHRPKMEDDAARPPENVLKPADDLLKRGDAPPASGHEPGDLRRFALDFVRSEQSDSLADQHRFYAESVHFYGEGDLSWAGVAAATRRYQRENPNRQYGATAPAAVKGPVDGGFYVVDQPISWIRTDGSRQTRGRSIIRLRVVSSGRGGWKITSIEEIGQ